MNMLKMGVLALLILLLSSAVYAQDSTQEAAQATVDAPVVINIEAPAETPQSADGSLWGYVLVIGTIIVGGFVSLSLGLQAIGNRAQAAARNPLEVAVLEKAYDSVPSAVVKAILEPIKESLERSDAALKKMTELFDKVSDKIPENEKSIVSPIAPNAITPSGDTYTQKIQYPSTVSAPRLDPTSYTVSSSNVEPPQTP